MDVNDILAPKREPNDIMYIKDEEFVDDFSQNKYIWNSSIDNEEIKAEPGVFAMYDNTQEDNKFSLNLINNDPIVREHPVQDGSQSFASDTRIKRKRRKQSELKAERKATFAQKSNGRGTKPGRISRDEIFKNKEYFCSQCQKSYLGRKCLRKHFKDHYNFCQGQYVCLICNNTSRTVSHMNRHILETHVLKDYEDEKLFACTLCEKRFYDKKDLDRHMFSHTGIGTHSCAECDYSCTHKYRLKAHISSVHGQPRTSKTAAKQKRKPDDSDFICNYCNYSSNEKSALRTHIIRHLGQKSFECPECNYTCTARCDLVKHCTIHSDDRPFVCSGCRKTFKRRSHLLIHFNGKCDCRGMSRRKKNSKNVKM